MSPHFFCLACSEPFVGIRGTRPGQYYARGLCFACYRAARTTPKADQIPAVLSTWLWALHNYESPSPRRVADELGLHPGRVHGILSADGLVDLAP